MRALAVVAGLTAALIAQAAGQAPSAPSNDLDALMARTLKRRDVNRQTLNQYVLDELETFELLGPGGTPVTRMRREYTWYVRNGIHVRSPVRFDGVPISDTDRRAYEARWYQSELDRRQRRHDQDRAQAEKHEPPAGPAVNEPRFVSESYFLDFHFDPGNYYLVGHEPVDGHDTLRIEYYPTRMFTDPDDDDPDAPPSTAEQDLNRKMNKTALVTLWVDPTEDQIVEFTFDNVWLDFLPAAWLVRVDDLRASMAMGQPFKGVWLPRNLSVHGAVTLANGSFQATYRREFSNYRQADVHSRIRIKQPEAR
ncbi:MAG TPA: hypothetical protein VFX12_12590 [Vicinamibacterales bacterium]|nr:hypothetical protein [Vicinamibacterales bacterium]